MSQPKNLILPVGYELSTPEIMGRLKSLTEATKSTFSAINADHEDIEILEDPSTTGYFYLGSAPASSELNNGDILTKTSGQTTMVFDVVSKPGSTDREFKAVRCLTKLGIGHDQLQQSQP